MDIFLHCSWFFASQMDRIILGKYLTMAEFGVYSLAFMLSHKIDGILYKLSQSVLFPAYSRIARENISKLRKNSVKTRIVIMAVSLPPMCILIVAGPEIVRFLYDERYVDAGWMLQILCIAGISKIIQRPVTSIFLAVGDSFRHFLLLIMRTAVIAISMIIGGWLYGTVGIIWAIPISGVIGYPFMALLVYKYHVLVPILDLVTVVLIFIAVSLGFIIKHSLFY